MLKIVEDYSIFNITQILSLETKYIMNCKIIQLEYFYVIKQKDL